MVEFNINQFLIDKRLGVYELADKLKVPFQTIYVSKARGTIKLSFLRKLESIFGDCSDYIIKEEENQVA